MQIITGQPAPDFSLIDINGIEFKTERLQGKRYLLTFYRFASCPFCNLRLHRVIQKYKSYGNDFEVIAVFDSTLKNLQKYSSRHQSPFPILADENQTAHRLYQIKHSTSGVIKGVIFRFPSLILSLLKGYIPWRIKGDITAMPADFLIDENGIIQTIYYGRDEGDHIPMHLIKQFAQRRGELESDLLEI